MNTALIDSVFLSETDEEYFYILNDGENFVYGGYFANEALTNFLISLYDNEPSSRPDLIEFAKYVMKSTDS